MSRLAETAGAQCIAVLLDGSDSDGVLGLRAVKAAGGVTMAEESAAGAIVSASAAGVVDFELPGDEIADEIIRLVHHAYMLDEDRDADLMQSDELRRIFALLQNSHDIDLTHYKPSTIRRRIQRRMAVNKIESLKNYADYIRTNPGELDQLYEDVLIRVTSLFRDPDVFDYLRKEVFPNIVRDRSTSNPIRVWVPGCATGEEVYSLAIGLIETMAELNVAAPLQIFGTDVSDQAVDRARLGLYPQSIAEDISPERLRRFFTKVDGQYRVAKSIRDCCIFARQNVTKDPPFSRLDLISCRNVMIYFGAVLQRKVMSIFHYALRPNGYLLLGNSETIGNFGEFFAVADRKHKIYVKKNTGARLAVDFTPAQYREPRPSDRDARQEEDTQGPGALLREADRVVLTRYAPPGVLVTEDLQIVQFRGRTSMYLEPAPGTATFDLLKMAREGLLADLRTAIHKAKKTDIAVRRDGVRVRSNGGFVTTNIEVVPFTTQDEERYYLVLFEDVPQVADAEVSAKGRKGAAVDNPKQLARLKKELEATREYLQSIIEEQEAMNEELRSANEEVQSSNEELQSTNEELETAKEELQSSNEELTTLNEELENRNAELAQLNNDLVNLLASIDIPILMLGNDLRIRRFNPAANKVLNLIPTDVGRSIGDMKLTLKLDNLEELVEEVIDSLRMRELQVQDRKDHHYLLRIRPYKTIENKIEGAVLALLDIEAYKSGML